MRLRSRIVRNRGDSALNGYYPLNQSGTRIECLVRTSSSGGSGQRSLRRVELVVYKLYEYYYMSRLSPFWTKLSVDQLCMSCVWDPMCISTTTILSDISAIF